MPVSRFSESQVHLLLLVMAFVLMAGCVSGPSDRTATSGPLIRDTSAVIASVDRATQKARQAIEKTEREPSSVAAAITGSPELDLVGHIETFASPEQATQDPVNSPAAINELQEAGGDFVQSSANVKSTVRLAEPIPMLEPENPQGQGNETVVWESPVNPGVSLEGGSLDRISMDGNSADGNSMEMNLPSALAMVGGQHPAVGLAQWRVREAYARLAQTQVLWLPSIQAGFSFHRHDGNYQASNGAIVDVNRNSFQYGLGVGGTGAGTTPRPGLVAQFHLADAVFQPRIAERTAWARGHAAKAVMNSQLLTVALAYTQLLQMHQDLQILVETRNRTSDLAKITTDFAEAGEGLKSDADRVQTELTLIDNRIVSGRERIMLASARLANAISVDASVQIMPLDVTVLPLELMATDFDKDSLIRTGLTTRPELKEAQALVAAACEAFNREKYAPFVPSVLLGYSTSGFGGGLGNQLDDVEGRYDFDALMSWQIRNFGYGERAARRVSSARVQQAKYEKLVRMDQVALEISEAASQVEYRQHQLEITQRAIQFAENSYQSNLERIRDGEGLPIEALQAIQALESARRAYLQAVIDHNRAQFQLQWAVGWSMHG